jgi:hydrogenase/urease accessory protein HupE
MTIVALAVCAMWPGTAEAHLMNTGLGPVYDGISHLLLTFDDLLPVVAMALLAGLNGPAAGRRVLFTLPLCWLAGGAAGYAIGAALLPAGFTSLSLLTLGILTATDLKLRLPVVTGLAAILGLLHGWGNGAGIAAAGREELGLIGITVTIFVLAALIAALDVSLRRPAARIVVRVAGSWIAAIGLLLLGWRLSGRG